MIDEDYKVLIAAIQRLEVQQTELTKRVTEIWEALITTAHGPGMFEEHRQLKAAVTENGVRTVELTREIQRTNSYWEQSFTEITRRIDLIERAPEIHAKEELEKIKKDEQADRRVLRDTWIRTVASGALGAVAVIGSTLLLFGKVIKDWLSSGGN